MNIAHIVKIVVCVLTLCCLANFAQAQKDVFINGDDVRAWSDCDTSVVVFEEDNEGLLHIKMPNHGWICLEVNFNETNILDYEAFEIDLAAECSDSLKHGSMMFKFQDVNGYRSVHEQDEIFFIDTDTSFSKITIQLDDFHIKEFFPKEAVVDPQRINAINLYFRFGTHLPHKQYIYLLINSIRFY